MPASPTQPTQAPSAGAAPSSSPTQAAAAATALPPRATPLPEQASPTPLPPTITPDSIAALRRQAQALLDSPEWNALAQPPTLVPRWAEFASGAAELSQFELYTLQVFIERWAALIDLIASALPQDSQPALRVTEFFTDAGVSQPTPYVIDERSAAGEQLFLLAKNSDGEAQALLLAPPIQELRQRPSPDGDYVEYYDEKDRLYLRADARPLDSKNGYEKALIDMLAENDADALYGRADIYPRFYFNLPDVPSGFYLVEKLTLNQIKLLIATIQEFDRPAFAGLKAYTFTPGDNVPFLISREDHPFAAALALPMGGDPPHGIILLYSRNLFDSKYETIGSIAHEVVHVWQGVAPGCDKPQARLQREIGNGLVPSDLYDWEPGQIIEQSRGDHQLGAYHMSLWVAMHYNLQNAIRFYRNIITTGTANGQPIINCGR